MSGRISAVLFLISLLVAFFVYWPDDPDEAEKDREETRYTERMNEERYRDRKETESARSAMRSRSGVRQASPEIRTESGLVYRVLREGSGAKPVLTSKVEIKFRMYLPDGADFTRSPGEEAMVMSLSGLIKGLQEGMQLMPVGSKYRFIIPPELGYGEKGTAGVPLNQTLLIDVELLGIVEPLETKD